MTYNDDFIPVEDNEDLEAPEYPVVFGVALSPIVQGVLVGILGVGAAIFLFVRFVSPLGEQKTAIQNSIQDKRQVLETQQESLREVEAVRAELDAALQQRAGIYSLLGDPNSFDTLLLDINQQIENSNASIEQVIAGNLAGDAAALASLGLTQEQIDRLIQETAEDPIQQKLFYTSELFAFNPVGLPAPVEGDYGEPLAGKLERQTVEVEFEALFNQTQNILYNLERLEPLVIIRDFNQEPTTTAPEGFNEEDLNALGISRLLNTSFTLDVLVPTGDPLEPPPAPEPEPTPEEGAEGAPAEGEGEGEG